jgi:hypothetical protein
MKPTSQRGDLMIIIKSKSDKFWEKGNGWQPDITQATVYEDHEWEHAMRVASRIKSGGATTCDLDDYDFSHLMTPTNNDGGFPFLITESKNDVRAFSWDFNGFEFAICRAAGIQSTFDKKALGWAIDNLNLTNGLDCDKSRFENGMYSIVFCSLDDGYDFVRRLKKLLWVW